jgi:hypothetical protein
MKRWKKTEDNEDNKAAIRQCVEDIEVDETGRPEVEE